MKQGTAIFLGVLMALLGLADAGQAQPPQTVQVQGTIRAVDCQAYTVTLDTAGGPLAYRTAPSAAITVNSAGVPLCALQQYTGASANVWVTAIQSELVITRIDTVGQGYAPSQPAPYAPGPSPYQAPASGNYAPSGYYAPPTYYAPPAYYAPPTYYAPPAYYAPPLVGVVLGTVIVAGLVYLLVRHSSGALYRYPYYGSYYRNYYRPIYRPYYGPLRYAPAYGWCHPTRVWGYRC